MNKLLVTRKLYLYNVNQKKVGIEDENRHKAQKLDIS